MVFKSIAGESEPIIGKWNSFQSINEYSLEALSKDNTFKHHYKNRIVQDWKTFNPKKVYYNCCGASEPEASERSSSLIRAVGSKKQIFSVAWDCGRAQMCAQLPQIGLS